MKPNCPQLTSRPVQDPAPTTLRISDGCQEEAYGRAFQFIAKEARAALDVVVGMCSFIFMLFYFMHAYDCHFLGMFLVNFVPSLVLVNSGATRSFRSTSFNRGFSFPREPLDRPLIVAISDEHTILASNIYQVYVFEIFGVEFPIYLIPIVMKGVSLLLWV